ncbi:VWA domain-containing protein [Flaviaesturariibacter aridisoli]|uniref:VWA domain-containing protein n=1 Tax=Flaviaesturariibacter aridisoli TaxID=2545761 RepID=A0A4R4E240_9BACT|nr:VWA domain-containing protein [Flaviaesturariibacter aridisoli]TCZ73516.1 VWA domain-containing protein [Flaviaesturariibacter aridisoli]
MIYDWLQQLSFAYTWVLPFLGLVPVLAILWTRSRQGRRPALRVSTAAVFRVRSAKAGWLFLLPLLRTLAGLLLVAALARPQVRDVQKRFQGNGISIVLCMDVSGSMATPDFTPYRLAVAKEVAMDFVRARPVDQIGLVVFAGESFTQFPISTDHEALLEQIKSLRPDMLQRGTLIGEGLANSVARLKDVPGKSKVVVLLTDGSEEAPPTRIIDPETAIGIARAKGVKVYTIGLNSGTIMAPDGQRPAPGIDEGLLQRMAAATGGAYFRARDKQALEGVYARINVLEKSDVQVVNRTRYHEEYHWFLLGALFFLLLEGLLRYTLFRTLP